MELYINFTKVYFSWKYIFPVLSFLGMLGLRWMCMHLWMNLIKRTWYPRKIKNCENLCTKSMESCRLVISHILAEFHPDRATYTTLHNHFSFKNGLSKSAQTFTVGFVNLLSTHPIHIVVWGNFPFNFCCDGICFGYCSCIYWQWEEFIILILLGSKGNQFYAHILECFAWKFCHFFLSIMTQWTMTSCLLSMGNKHSQNGPYKLV